MSQKQYCIMIKARGPHHEGHGTGNRQKDADHLLVEFLERLRGLGHEVSVASFAYDGKAELLVGTPRDLNNLDDVYGISADHDDEQENDSELPQPIADILHNTAVIGEKLDTLLSEFRGFVAYEVAEDADDPKAPKKRAKKTPKAPKPQENTSTEGAENTSTEGAENTSTEGAENTSTEGAENTSTEGDEPSE